MTNKEIEVGDYVYLQIRKKLHIAQVMNKYLTCDTFVLQHGEVIKSEVIKDIQPIILTVEILENNGFTSYDVLSVDENGNECVSGKQCEYVEGESKINVYFFNNEVVSFEVYGNHAECKAEKKHVHDLQHAMKFCEIEKELKL